MVTDNSKWLSVKKIGDYEIKRQWITSHTRWLYAVFGWSTFDGQKEFVQQVSWWLEDECEDWINARIKIPNP